jgi:hypothetical protein
VPAEAVRQLEENGIVSPPQNFQADDLFIEPLHDVQVMNTQGNLTQSLDASLAHSITVLTD